MLIMWVNKQLVKESYLKKESDLMLRMQRQKVAGSTFRKDILLLMIYYDQLYSYMPKYKQEKVLSPEQFRKLITNSDDEDF